MEPATTHVERRHRRRRSILLHAFWFIVCALALPLQLAAARADAATISYVHDELGRLVGVVDPTGDTALYTYDAAGNLLSISRFPSAVVSIIAFTPSSGPPAATVAIVGTGFSAVASQNTVTFNGVAAVVSSASPTRLVVAVPATATTGAIRVTTPAGTALSTQSFTVTAPTGPPTITGFTPDIGPPGTPVTVAGAGFDANPALNKLAFNGTGATINSAAPTTLTTRAPSGATSGPISVATPFGKATSADIFVTADVAVPIGIDGPPVTVTLSEPRQTARLAFNGTAGQRASLGMVNVSIPGSEVSLSRVDGTSLGSPQFVGVSGGAIDAAPLPVSGRYVILVDPRDNNAGSMTVYLSSDLTGNVAIGGSATVSTVRPGQNARLSFSGTAGQQVSLQIASGAVASDVSVLNPDGSILAAPSFAGASGSFIDQKTLASSGSYSVLVDPRSTNTGSMTVTLVDATDVTSTIAIGGSATVTTTRPGQNARLAFTAAAGRQVSVQIASGAVAGDVSILNPDGSILAAPSFAGASGSFIDQKTLPSSGPHTILVDPRSTNTGSVTLTLLDATDVTGTVAVGGSASVTTARAGQNARLRFTGVAGQQVSLQIAAGAVASDVSILNPDGSTLAAPTFAGASGAFIDQRTLATDGTHTVLIDPRSTNTGSLTLTLVDATDVTGTLAIGGPPLTVSIARPGQNARLTFSGAAGQQATVRLAGNTIGTTAVTLLSIDGTTLTSTTSALTSFTLPTLTLPATGTYTINADPAATRTGSVTVSVTSP